MEIEPNKFTAKDARGMSQNYKESLFRQQHQATYNQIIEEIKKTADETENTRIIIDGDIHPSIIKKLKDAGFLVQSKVYDSGINDVTIMW